MNPRAGLGETSDDPPLSAPTRSARRPFSLVSPERRLRAPSFYIVGAAKCGTTSLFEALAQHPDIFCCPVKEPNYFAFNALDPDAASAARAKGAAIDPAFARLLEPPKLAVTAGYEDYLNLFVDWRGQRATGEASTVYLVSPVASEAIAARRPDARIVIVLRDPVRRAYSQYLMYRQTGVTAASFSAVVREELLRLQSGQSPIDGVICRSLYADQLQRYFDRFPREQILVLLFDELVNAPDITLERVFRHLGVDPALGKHIRIGWRNRSRAPRFAWLNHRLFMSGKKWLLLRSVPRPLRRALRPLYFRRTQPPPPPPAEETALRNWFGRDIARTGEMIQRDLSHWMAGAAPLAHPSFGEPSDRPASRRLSSRG